MAFLDELSALEYVSTFGVVALAASGFALLFGFVVALFMGSDAASGMLLAGAMALVGAFVVGWYGGAQALDELPGWAMWVCRGMGALVATITAVACVVSARSLR